MSNPGLDQGSIDREVLVGEQALPAGLTQYCGKEAIGHLTRQQAIPILTEHGGIPYPLIAQSEHAVARVPTLGAIPSGRRTSVSMMQRLVDSCPFRKLRLVC
jgi:hypothetical protein